MADTEQFDDVFAMMEGAEGHGELARKAIARAKALPIWTGPVEPRVQPGGMSNLNLIVEDGAANTPSAAARTNPISALTAKTRPSPIAPPPPSASRPR